MSSLQVNYRQTTYLGGALSSTTPYQWSFGKPSPELAALPGRLAAVATLTDLRWARGHGLWGWPARVLMRLPGIGSHRPAISLVTLAK